MHTCLNPVPDQNLKISKDMYENAVAESRLKRETSCSSMNNTLQANIHCNIKSCVFTLKCGIV
jgi:hypothetical protein